MNNGWRIANVPKEDGHGHDHDAPLDTDVVSQFLSAYVPLVRLLSHLGINVKD